MEVMEREKKEQELWVLQRDEKINKKLQTVITRQNNEMQALMKTNNQERIALEKQMNEELDQ
jgi:hypothetical protein